MKKYLLIPLIAVLTSASLIAPPATSVTVKWGAEMKEPKRSTITDIIGFDDKYTYALRSQFKMFGSEIFIESFDKKYQLKASEEIELEYQKKKLSFEFVEMIANELYIFASFHNNKLNKSFLFYQKLNKTTLRPTGALKKIAETGAKSRYNAGTFTYELSANREMIAIMAHQSYKKDELDAFEVVIFDNTLTEQWRKEITVPYEDKLFSFKDYEVDAQGNFYFLGKIYFDKVKSKVGGEPNFNYSIFAYRNKGVDKEEYNVELEDLFITDLNFEIDDDADIVCAGFYSKKNTYSISGTYFLSIDPITKIVKSKGMKEFDTEFMSQFMSEKKAAKGKKELANYDIDRMILRADGGALILAEYYRSYTTTSFSSSGTGGTTTRTIHHYVYGNIIAININPDNSIEWIKKIPKYQHTTNDNGLFSSFADIIVKDRIYLIYNDNPLNLAEKEPRRIKTYNRKNSVVTLVTIKPDGEFSKKLLFDNKDQEVVTRPKACEQVDENRMVIYGEKKKKFRLGDLTFDS